jgi:hypothetical protein
MDFRLDSNIKEFTRELNAIQRQQIPFATSRAINDVAVMAQDQVISGIPRVFNNIKKWWLKQQPTGIKVQFSNKSNLHAAVHTSAYFAKMQEEGGTKQPRTAKNLAVPTARVAKKYRTSHGARELMDANKNVFRTSKGVFRRTGKKRYPIQLLWSFTPTAKIKPRFRFYDTCKAAVQRNFEVQFKMRLAQALATAKRPSR